MPPETRRKLERRNDMAHDSYSLYILKRFGISEWIERHEERCRLENLTEA